METDPLIGSIVAGRYRVERLLGSGGMGAVYRAEHVHMRKTVALKVLHKELAGVNEIVARFEREAIAAGRVEHPNVAPATDFGKLEDGSFYLVLEYVDGKSLRELLEQGPLAWERAVAIAKQVVSALVAAHAAGIVHRDLKPDNVMLVELSDGSERVKVLDFGIARVTLSDAKPDATHLTKVGAVMGTVAYMSPEQALGDDVDERTDLYALGVIVHEMISGHIPFDADSAAQILAKQITEAPPPLPSGAPRALAELVTELLKKTRLERPPSARAVLERLEGLSSVASSAPRLGASVSAAPVVDPKRRRALVLGVGIAAAVVGVLGAVALSGGDEQAVTPETLRASDAPPPAASKANPSTPPKPSASMAAPASPSNPTAGKSTSRRKKEPAPDSTKKKTGPGGIYIPPPSQWF
ncbi:MAG TPA: protein kinase [Polyangiaceae bacterium]|nr:protein kinase [Polyangiaceae bacterium]